MRPSSSSRRRCPSCGARSSTTAGRRPRRPTTRSSRPPTTIGLRARVVTPMAPTTAPTSTAWCSGPSTPRRPHSSPAPSSASRRPPWPVSCARRAAGPGPCSWRPGGRRRPTGSMRAPRLRSATSRRRRAGSWPGPWPPGAGSRCATCDRSSPSSCPTSPSRASVRGARSRSARSCWWPCAARSPRPRSATRTATSPRRPPTPPRPPCTGWPRGSRRGPGASPWPSWRPERGAAARSAAGRLICSPWSRAPRSRAIGRG